MKRRLAEAVVGLALGGALLGWVLRDFDWAQLLAFRKAWIWIVLAAVFMTAAHGLRAWRWKLMLEASCEKTEGQAAFWALMVGYLANTALPRVGEVVRCTLLWRWRGVSVPVAFGSVVAERVVDLLLLAFLALTVVGVEGSAWLTLLGLRAWLPYVGAIALVGLLGLWALWRFWLRHHRSKWIAALVEGFRSFGRVRPRSLAIFLSLGIWVGYWLAIVGVMVAYAGDLPPAALLWSAWVLLVGSGVAMALPVPGGIGTFHAIGLLLLEHLGWEHAQAQLTVVAAHAMQTLLVILLGAVGWVYGMAVRLPQSQPPQASKTP